MILTTELISTYLDRIQQATTERERKHIIDDLLLFYYRLDDEKQETSKSQMQPILDDLGRKLAQEDPLVQRAHQLLGISI